MCSRTFTFQERERRLALKAENENSCLQKAEDRACIECVVAMVLRLPACCKSIVRCLKYSDVLSGTCEPQTLIVEERERLLALQAENEDLWLREAEDRAHLSCLVAMFKASRHRVCHFRAFVSG